MTIRRYLVNKLIKKDIKAINKTALKAWINLR
jgi:hypothetical protein